MRKTSKFLMLFLIGFGVGNAAAAANENVQNESTVATQENNTAVSKHTIFVDVNYGSPSGGYYDEEQRLVDTMGIYKVYTDGSKQQAKQSMTTIGVGLNYHYVSSTHWATLFTYMYRSTSHSLETGDGKVYRKENISTQTLSKRHMLMIGKELRYDPTEGFMTFEIGGQIGYEMGNYLPLATYVDYRTKLTPVPSAYTGPTDISIHGPTARIGGGFTMRFSPTWLMRMHAYYQGTYSMASEKIWNAVEKNTYISEFYGIFAIGYSL